MSLSGKYETIHARCRSERVSEFNPIKLVPKKEIYHMCPQRKLPFKTQRRRRFVEETLDLVDTEILEIGAYDNPMYAKDERDVKYLDWFSTQELLQLAAHGNSNRNPERICDVDYPVKEKRFSRQVNRKFGLIIANHVIEHVPDVITWLQEISKILEAGGHLFLSVPDKNFTFDALRRETNITDLLRCWELDLERPDRLQIFDALYFGRPLTRTDFYDGSAPEKMTKKSYTVMGAFNRAKKLEREYFNIHCSVFSAGTFMQLLEELTNSGLVNFRCVRLGGVQAKDNEFHVLLRSE